MQIRLLAIWGKFNWKVEACKDKAIWKLNR